VCIDGSHLVPTVPPGTSPPERAKVLARWERRELRERIPALLAEWEATARRHVGRLGYSPDEDQVGLLRPSDQPGRINTELEKKSPRCLEYIVVHELLHIRERGHGPAFFRLMDRHLPDRRNHHHELNSAPLSAENWPD
jgi:predicted metal-dependent hydrolase